MTELQRTGVLREVASLVQTLQRQQQNVHTDAVLTALLRSAVAGIPGAEAAGITVAHSDGKVTNAIATDHYPVPLDEIQQRHKQGPCLSAAWEHHVIRINDMAAEDRWPYFCRDALEKTLIRSVMSF